MKIVNSTHWRSDQIMAIVRRVADDELDSEKRRGFEIRVVYARWRHGRDHGTTGGCAPYFGRWIKLKVQSDAVDTVDLAHTIAHEFGHTRGVRHNAMRGSSRYSRYGDWRERYAWAKDFPVERVEATPKPTTADKRLARLGHADKMAEAWRRKVKRAEGRVAYWRRRAMAIRRTLAAAAIEEASAAEAEP